MTEPTPSTQPTPPNDERAAASAAHEVIVVGPSPNADGVDPDSAAGPADGADGPDNPADLVNQPAKVMRIGSMIKQLLEEVRSAPLDEAGRRRLREVHQRSIKELEAGLAPELIEELERISLPFSDDGVPSEAELRIAQAQLVGWLEGLFHGIQTALFAQQMAAQAQFDEMRRHAALEAAPGGGAPDRPAPNGPYL
jgi:hypothetical protein